MRSAVPLLLITMSVVADAVRHYSELLSPAKNLCYSCGSHAYVPLWNQLVHHYFPPHNFTDRCWQPDHGIATVQCNSACFTLVERIDQKEYHLHDQRGVLRGCIDRLYLFGLDEDVRSKLTTDMGNDECRDTHRKILRLYALSTEDENVKYCSCTGTRCNDKDMLLELNSTNTCHLYCVFLISLIFAYLL